MLVDDEANVLTVSRKMLEKEGYMVHSFDNPRDDLDHVKHGGCRACIFLVSDIRMPGMSGFELVRQMKEVPPDIKVIRTSSFVIHAEELHKVMPSLHIDDFAKNGESSTPYPCRPFRPCHHPYLPFRQEDRMGPLTWSRRSRRRS